MVKARSSSRAVAASAKSTPCLERLARAFAGSHSHLAAPLYAHLCIHCNYCDSGVSSAAGTVTHQPAREFRPSLLSRIVNSFDWTLLTVLRGGTGPEIVQRRRTRGPRAWLAD